LVACASSLLFVPVAGFSAGHQLSAIGYRPIADGGMFSGSSAVPKDVRNASLASAA
jgi:hypothetical protein